MYCIVLYGIDVHQGYTFRQRGNCCSVSVSAVTNLDIHNIHTLDIHNIHTFTHVKSRTKHIFTTTPDPTPSRWSVTMLSFDVHNFQGASKGSGRQTRQLGWEFVEQNSSWITEPPPGRFQPRSRKIKEVVLPGLSLPDVLTSLVHLCVPSLLQSVLISTFLDPAHF